MLKIGLIGIGKLGILHAQILKASPHFELVGVYDSDPARLKSVCEEMDIMPYTSALGLIKEVDVVDIVTPAHTHYEYAVAAIKNAKHVFIEKPITHTIEEALHIEQLANEADVFVQVGHIERFNPAFKAVENYQLQPMFIEAHRLSTFDPRGTDVSVVLDLMVHDLDIILTLTKSNIRSIQANGVSVITDNIDIANARIEFDNGCVANITCSRVSMKKMRKIRLFQKDAYISMDFLEKKAEIIKIAEGASETGLTLHLEGKEKNLVVIHPKSTPSNALQEELESFAICIQSNKTPKVSASDGVKAMEIAHQVLKKIRKNSLV
ncbi:MAG: Gfo/Idh/MocA family oxidoreductase [Chitinophagales bacterium]|nr:Gfo/Idh/MocA family oxidoreductase [Chitinophagales bacterium]